MMPPQDKQEVQNLFGMENAQLRNSNYMQLVHLKLIITSLAKNRKYLKNGRSEAISKERLENILKMSTHLILSIDSPIPKSQKQRQAIAGNYCQILRALAQLNYFENMLHYKLLFDKIKRLTRYDYGSDIKPRDFAEVVQAVCILYDNQQREALTGAANIKAISIQKEMKLVSQRAALLMGKMTPQTREIIYHSFSKIDSYYEPNLY